MSSSRPILASPLYSRSIAWSDEWGHHFPARHDTAQQASENCLELKSRYLAENHCQGRYAALPHSPDFSLPFPTTVQDVPVMTFFALLSLLTVGWLVAARSTRHVGLDLPAIKPRSLPTGALFTQKSRLHKRATYLNNVTAGMFHQSHAHSSSVKVYKGLRINLLSPSRTSSSRARKALERLNCLQALLLSAKKSQRNQKLMSLERNLTDFSRLRSRWDGYSRRRL